MLQIDARIVAGNLAQHRVVLQQPRAHALQTMHARRGCGGNAIDFVESRLDGRRVHIAHQLADVLHLPPSRTMAGEALRIAHRTTQRIRQVNFLESVRRQGDQLLPQVLEGFHFALAGRFAGPGVGIVAIQRVV